MMNILIKKLLRENIEVMSGKPLIEKFIDFVKNNLGIKNNLKIKLTTSRDGLTTTAYYDLNNSEVCVYVKNRMIVDILRSIAHEMVHHHQKERGDLTGNKDEGADGSPFENEANAEAGRLIRIFGRQNPEIYES